MSRKQREQLADALLALDDTVTSLATTAGSRTVDGYKLSAAQYRDLIRAHSLLMAAGVRLPEVGG